MTTLRAASRLVLTCCLLASAATAEARRDFAEGVRLLRAGKASEALTRLRLAEEAQGDEVTAGLLQNLALAAWRAGRVADAEAYAERAAAKDPGLRPLRENLVGAARLTEAREALQGGDLATAEARARRAIQAFETALRELPGREDSRRNLARGLRTLREIEEARKQREDEEKDDEDEKKDEKKKDEDEKKKDEEEKKDDEKKQDEKKQDEKKQEDKKGDEQKPEKDSGKDDEKKPSDEKPQSPSEQKDEPGERSDKEEAELPERGPGKDEPRPEPATEERQEKPGPPEGDTGKVASEDASKSEGATAEKPRALSDEERKRLLHRLRQLVQDAQRRRAKEGARHKPGKKDW